MPKQEGNDLLRPALKGTLIFCSRCSRLFLTFQYSPKFLRGEGAIDRCDGCATVKSSPWRENVHRKTFCPRKGARTPSCPVFFGVKCEMPNPQEGYFFAPILPNILAMIYAIDSTRLKEYNNIPCPLSLKHKMCPIPFLLLPQVSSKVLSILQTYFGTTVIHVICPCVTVSTLCS